MFGISLSTQLRIKLTEYKNIIGNHSYNTIYIGIKKTKNS